MLSSMFDFITASPTAYQAVAATVKILQAHGYQALSEGDAWHLDYGKKYYVTRNGSSLIAFHLPEQNFPGFLITAAHSDSPCFKVKENAELRDSHYTRLSVEKYGGMLCSTWMDRPLSIAGRVIVRTKQGIESRLVDLKDPIALIPNLAIHMNRSANENSSFNAAVDMLPLTSGTTLKQQLADRLSVSTEEILSTDLFLYNPQPCIAWGEYISAPRLDDLMCAYASLAALCEATPTGNAAVYCLFDNEETGSQSKQGAASTFLPDVLERIVAALGMDSLAYRQKISSSFLVSCDNAHANHPNHGEYADKNHSVYMNQGVVIKYHANQKYTTDAVSTAIFRLICEKAGVPVQYYANRADLPGGSTLGNISNTQVSLNSVDIGLAQLAMHSSYETAGAKDVADMISALKQFFQSTLSMHSDGSYTLH